VRSETRQSRLRTAPGPATNALTLSIVGVVVLVNSVAWGIPLLTGTDRGGTSNHAKRPAPITTGAIPRPARRPEFPADTSALVPLPARLPATAPDAVKPAHAKRDNTQAVSLKTLYPLPEPAPAKLLVPPSPPPAEAPATRKVRIVSAPRYGRNDTALVSPYTPGVRGKPAAKKRQLNPVPEALPNDTPLSRAREIARRAARRFEAMRARLEAPETHSQVAAGSHTTLPLSATHPTASLIGSSSASKSAVAYVRPRIVRRPIQTEPARAADETPITVAAAPQGTAADEAVPRQAADTSGRHADAPSADAVVPVPSLNPRPRPHRTASLEERKAAPERSAKRPLTRAAEPASRPAPAVHESHASTSSRRRAERRHARQAVDRAKRRQRRIASRRKPRKIDGFRPSFHRQLVSVGFFGAQR
jgi:hypothetical protein